MKATILQGLTLVAAALLFAGCGNNVAADSTAPQSAPKSLTKQAMHGGGGAGADEIDSLPAGTAPKPLPGSGAKAGGG